MSSPRRSGSSGVSGRSGSGANLNAQYRALMRTAHEENRNGNPYNDKYTFTVQGKRKVSSKARKFIKTALLAGGVAGLGLFFKAQIGNDLKKLMDALTTKGVGARVNEAVGGAVGGARAKYLNAAGRVTNWHAAARKNANAKNTTPGWGGRALQGWNSTSMGATAARNAAVQHFKTAQGWYTTSKAKRAQMRLSQN